MPYHIEIDLDSGVAFETWTGALTVEDVLECIETRHARADYDESTPRLVDISKAYGDLSAAGHRIVAVVQKAEVEIRVVSLHLERGIRKGAVHEYLAVAICEIAWEAPGSEGPQRIDARVGPGRAARQLENELHRVFDEARHRTSERRIRVNDELILVEAYVGVGPYGRVGKRRCCQR